jgi:hypothetical protein
VSRLPACQPSTKAWNHKCHHHFFHMAGTVVPPKKFKRSNFYMFFNGSILKALPTS